MATRPFTFTFTDVRVRVQKAVKGGTIKLKEVDVGQGVSPKATVPCTGSSAEDFLLSVCDFWS